MNRDYRRSGRGFTLIEILVALTILGILMGIAMPSYRAYIVKQGRSAAQSELIEIAALQEKIYLNSNPNAYTTNLRSNYTGDSNGGLGRTTGQTTDGKYDIALVNPVAQSWSLTATPVSGSSQAGDGVITINSNGTRTCDTAQKWCPKGIW